MISLENSRNLNALKAPKIYFAILYTSFTTDTEVFTEEQKVNIQSEYCY